MRLVGAGSLVVSPPGSKDEIDLGSCLIFQDEFGNTMYLKVEPDTEEEPEQ